jgi:radical SAM superfamily enzyme YgiQ (UPF0313 family)
LGGHRRGCGKRSAEETYQPKLDEKETLQAEPSAISRIFLGVIDLEQFSLVPKMFKPLMSKMGERLGKFFVVPIETGRGCPYGCNLHRNGFLRRLDPFQDQLKVFVEELLRLKERAKKEKGQIAVFLSMTHSHQ